MGKSNRARRNKGNTRPSSSGHSAELLTTTRITSASVFAGFQNVVEPTVGLIFNPVSIPEDLEKGADDGFSRIVMKKLLKRDAVTKLKGLQEFMEFCSGDLDNAKSILPHWPRLFNKLALDSDIRVRELVHKANELLILKVKRETAPYLKSFIGTWIITQCDPYAPAASAAQHAFSSVFPPAKQSEALMFCHVEILKMMQDNLISATPDSIAEPNGSTKDEHEAKYQLLMICTLSGMKLFVSMLSEESRLETVDHAIKIVNAQQFWAHRQSKISQIRGAWYGLITTLCHDLSGVFIDTKPKLIKSITCSLSESDALVAPAVWECVLQVISTFEDWWDHIDVSRLVLPHLWKSLKQGGMGNAVQVFPCLLPFFSRLPKEVIGTEIYFFREFFCCIRESFSLSRVKVASECNAVVKAFIECLQYSVNYVFSNPECEHSIARLLITEQLIPLLRTSLKPEGSHVAVSCFYPVMGKYLQNLEDQAMNERRSGKYSGYNDLLIIFWDSVYSEIINILALEHRQHCEGLNILELFFHAVYESSTYSSKKKRGEIMQYLKRPHTDEMEVTPPYAVLCQNLSVTFKHSVLFKYTVKICGYLCQKLNAGGLHPCCLKLLAEIIAVAGSSELFFELLEFLHVPIKGRTMAPCVFLQEVILRWAACSQFAERSLSSIVDIILCICFCVDKQSALHLLCTCSKFECQKLFAELVLKTLQSGEIIQLFQEWFHSPVFGAVLKNMVRRLFLLLKADSVNTDCSQVAAYRKAVLKYITEASSESPRIPRKYIGTILKSCFGLLTNQNSISAEGLGTDTPIDLVCDICKLLFNYSLQDENFQMLNSVIFHLFVMSVDQDKYHISERCWSKLCDVWQTFIEMLAEKNTNLHDGSFLLLASNYLHQFLLKSLSKKMKRHVMMIVVDFFHIVEPVYWNKFGESYCSVFSSMIEKIFPSCSEWENLKNGLNLNVAPSILKGKWFYPIVTEDSPPLCLPVLPQIIFTADFVSNLLDKILCAAHRDKHSAKLFRTMLVEHFPHLLWSLCYYESLEYVLLQTEKENPILNNLRMRCKDLAAFFCEPDKRELCSTLFHLSLCDGMKWGIPFEKFMQLASSSHEMKQIISELTKSIKNQGKPCVNYCCKPCGCCDDNDTLQDNKNHPGNDVVSEYITMQVCLRYAKSGFRVAFLSSVPKDFFNIKVTSPLERDYIGVLSEVSSCIQELGVQEILDNSEKILVFFHDLINCYRFFKDDENGISESYEDEGLLFVVNFVAISSVILKVMPDTLSCDLWYSIFEILSSWLKRCSKVSQKVCDSTSASIFTYQTCALVCMISDLFTNEEKGSVWLPGKAEWFQLFNDVISKEVVRLYLQVSESVKNSWLASYETKNLLVKLSQTMEFLNAEQIMTVFCLLQSEASANTSSTELIDSAPKFLCFLTPFLIYDSLPLQFRTYSLLNRIITHLATLLRSTVAADSDNQEYENSFKTFPLVAILLHITSIVESALDEIKLGEHCVLKPNTSSYTYAVGYLLAWSGLLEYLSATFSEERCYFIRCLEEHHLLYSMLMNVSRLLPENDAAIFCIIEPKKTIQNYEYHFLFAEPPVISSFDEPSERHVQHLACNLYFSTLKKLPALVRTWWNNLEKKGADFVEKYTSKYVSGLLSAVEISAVSAGNIKFNNMKVKARPVSREVTATYALEDSTVELSIQLPSNYPLSPIIADSKKKLGVGQWRNWLLQLTSFLNYHNGSIIDSLAMWKKNLDKKFEGVEECMICLFILHASSCKLPNKSCVTCKKKFHSSCLYKWFSTSNTATCPGCRNFF